MKRQVCHPAAILLLSTFGTSPAIAQQAGTHFADIERIACVDAFSEILPGDHNFCLANKALQKGSVKQALSHYKSAAAWGDKRSMFNMGLLLVRGDGVERDVPLGLAWLALAAERKKDALQRETLASYWKAASTDERDAANVLWNDLKHTYADGVALKRANIRFDREMDRMRRDELMFPLTSMAIENLPGFHTRLGIIRMLDEAAVEVLNRPPRAPGTERKSSVRIGELESVREGAQPPNP